MASSLPALHRNELVLPGWSTSWMVAAMRAATSSTGSKVCCKWEIFLKRRHGPESREGCCRVFLLPYYFKGKTSQISEKSILLNKSCFPASTEKQLHAHACSLGNIIRFSVSRQLRTYPNTRCSQRTGVSSSAGVALGPAQRV